MSQYEDKWIDHQHIWADKQLLPDACPDFFKGNYWQQRHSITGSSVGRGTTYFFELNKQQFVLRHYLRGGLIGKLLTDQYLFLGLANTRAHQEKKLLQHMQSLGLPAPIPAASQVVKKGLHYSADLITVKIPNAVDIHHILLERELSPDIWQEIGRTIARFHQHQIYHHDLNIHNVMLDDSGKVWLIDFDKCSVKTGEEWKQQNLDRLLRSLNKESTHNSVYSFSQSDWQHVLTGYKAFK